MSWREIAPPTRHSRIKGPVTIGVGSFGKGTVRLIFSFAADVMPKAWKAGATLGAYLGEGEHAGKLRLAPEGIRPFPLRLRKSGRFQLLMPLLERADTTRRHPSRVEFKVDGPAMIVTLPSWALPAGAPTKGWKS
jgi:hypothetical protein